MERNCHELYTLNKLSLYCRFIVYWQRIFKLWWPEYTSSYIMPVLLIYVIKYFIYVKLNFTGDCIQHFNTGRGSLTWDGSHADLVALNRSISLLPFHLQSVLWQDRQLKTTLTFTETEILGFKMCAWTWCLFKDLGQGWEESMTVAGFSKIKETSCETFSIPPVLQDGLTLLFPFSKNKIHLLFRLHLHNFQQGLPNKQCLLYFYPSIPFSSCPLHPSKHALSSHLV